MASVYVNYDANAGRLYFNDGTFWVVACTSTSNEQNAGTMYPTLIEDTNGNQIGVYHPPASVSADPDSSYGYDGEGRLTSMTYRR